MEKIFNNNFKYFYFYALINSILIKFLCRVLLKRNSVFFYINSKFQLHNILYFFTLSSLMNFSSLMDIVILDFPNKNFRFEISYLFWSHTLGMKFFLKCFTNFFVPILSLKSFFSSSSWLERELWDMFGIKVLLHGDLRRILTDYNFKGHPLCKDYPLVGYIELRYDDSYGVIVVDSFESSQEFRYFKFLNPWVKWLN